MNKNNFYPTAEDPVEEVTLSRSLDLFTITMIGVGGMIGAGIFVLTGSAAGVAGPALILVFFLNGLVTSLTAMVYAELGSAFPEAGGGYLWVKEGLGGAQGFLSGWMSWFAHATAGSLYALGFGRFAAELFSMAGVPFFGLSTNQVTLVWMTIIIVVFTLLNYRGVSETGKVGNIITMTKISILALFVLFGILAMLRTTDWHTRFTTGFMPNGIGGVLMAMGLTFIAFEGYEIIAQSGEEVRDPARNVPRAIFLAVLIAVVIYLLVGFTAIGATQPPPGLKVYQYLGQQKEIAIVDVAQQTFPFKIGAIVLLISGLVSTMSALNATSFSSSRVSFAMGRDLNLPAMFARIHPQRHTPYVAVLFSGGLMLLAAWVLPLEEVAAAADIMFLALFLQVNFAAMSLRRRRPDLKRAFMIPWYPVVPVLAVIANAILALYLFTFSITSWIVAAIWVVVGLLSYYIYFQRVEAMEKPKEVLMEEVLVSREYSVIVPVVDQEQARILGQIGAILAQANRGEVLALHVVRVPQQLTLGEGRLLLKGGRSYLETVIQQAKMHDVPVHTVIRLGRNVAEAIEKTVDENAANLLLLGWPGFTRSTNNLYGPVIDPLVDNPPTDIAVVRYRKFRPVHSILVPVAGGPNSQRAVRLAVHMAAAGGEAEPVKVRVLHLMPNQPDERERVRAEQILRETMDGIQYPYLEPYLAESSGIVEGILEEAEGFDLIVVGGSKEPLFRNLMFGNVSDQIAQKAKVTVIMVKRRSTPLHAFLRRTVVEPTSPPTGPSSSPPDELEPEAAPQKQPDEEIQDSSA